MKFSGKSMLVAMGMLLGATLAPSVGEAQSVYVGGGGVTVRDHGDRFHNRRGGYDGPRVVRRDHRRAYYRDHRRGGPRYYHGSRYDRRGDFHGHRRHYRDNGVVIRLR